MSLTFVNHNGDPISATQMPAMRAQGAELDGHADAASVHKGW